MDKKDILIFDALRKNSRLSCREIARSVKVSVVTVLNRIKKFEQEGLIKSYSVVPDYEKLGYDVQAIIHLRISKGKLFEVEKKIATHPNVFAVYDTTGAFDCLAITKFKNRRSLDSFLKKIQKYDFIERTETQLILNTIKEENIKVD